MATQEQPVIDVRGLGKRYGDVVAVEDVSFRVARGEIFGILGPNGAGKTTTVESIGGLRVPDRGTISVLGLDPQRDGTELHRRVGMQLQQSQLPEKIRVHEAVELYASFYRSPANPDELIDLLGLSAKRKSTYDKLSGGQKQRVSIALALIGNPEVAILDELTTGLDPQARRDTWQLVEEVRDRGVTVVLVTHFMDEAERLCDRVAVIDSGRVAAIDTPAGLVDAVSTEQRIRFRPSTNLDVAQLEALADVASVAAEGRLVVVTGTGNVLPAVTSMLARQHVIAHDLRVEQASLDDAYLALTGASRDRTMTQETS